MDIPSSMGPGASRDIVGKKDEVAPARDPREVINAIIRNQPDFAVKTYSWIRFSILRQRFLTEIGQYLPERGRILDLGCGFGLFAIYYAMMSSRRQVTGVELNPRRVEMAETCAKKLGVDNIKFVSEDALAWRGRHEFDAIYMLDLIHHLPREDVRDFLTGVRDLLPKNGRLLLKDVADRPHYKRLFTLALDRAMVGMTEPIYYWPPADLTALLRDLGFEVKHHAMNDLLPYPHMLYICTRV